MKKYLFATLNAGITFFIMTFIFNYTGWNIQLLVGWFPITAWFSTYHIIKANEGEFKYITCPWSIVGIAMLVSIIICLGLNLLNVPIILNGILTGLMYNLITKPVWKEKEIEK